MSEPRAAPDPAPPSSWGVRVLKWIGVVTAVISLVLGVQQITSRVRDSMARSREAAIQIEIARGQAARGAHADAWKSLDRAAALTPGDTVDAVRVEVGFAWLEDAHPGPGQPFSVITDAVMPALDRALVDAQGTRRADIIAHLGWATFLRTRDGLSGDPAAQYQQALAIDPRNPFANAMLGHWLMWDGGSIDTARERFKTALTATGATHDFVRRFQVAALMNQQSEAADAELLRVANDMRRGSEPLTTAVADRLYWIYTMRWGPNPPRLSSSEVTPGFPDLAATYEWILATSPAGQRSSEVSAYVRAMMQEGTGQRDAALVTLRGLQRADVPPSLREKAQQASVRLAGAVTGAQRDGSRSLTR